MKQRQLLLDTSVIIDFLRNPEKKAALLFKLAQEKYSLSISIITHTELYAGASVWNSDRARTELEVLFGGITILAISEVISQEAGKIRATYKTDLIDALIAATAISHGLPLVTFNTKHFGSIEGLELYAV